jgi:hypothetical protein
VGDLLYAATTTALAKLADIATGNALISGGVGVAPSWGKIGLTTHVTGTLPATNGGTGQASYAVGDLLFASTTTALSKLADVATGNALISGGVGVAPSYGKIGLTTHVTGTLPVANGGTGITSFGTGVATALGINVGTAGAFVVNGGALGTPSSGTVTNLTGTASININGTVGATTPNTGAFTTLSSTGNTTLGDASTDTATINAAATFNANAVISVNSTTNALRITQTGTGNCLVVEDSTNPDSTPFVIDASGRVLNGLSVAETNYRIGTNARTPAVQISGDFSSPNLNGALAINGTNLSAYLYLSRSEVVSDGSTLGVINFSGNDGTGDKVNAASISASVDGTPGTNDMPGRLEFRTTAAGASSTTERMRIDSAGRLLFGTTATGARVNISANSTEDALRITQTGAGNCLVVEDSTNPDATPFVIDNVGNLIQGNTSLISTPSYSGASLSPSLQSHGTTVTGSAIARFQWRADNTAPQLVLSKSRGASAGTNSIVSSGDFLGALTFNGDDGTNFITGATITAAVDGTPGTNDMPGRLVFSTTAAGASTPTERMRIDNQGRIGFNSTSLGGGSGQYRFAGNISGAVSSPGILYTPTVQSDVTTTATAFQTAISTQDNAFALTNIFHYQVVQGTITGGSRTAPTNQVGFQVNSSLTGATNNYGFRGDIAAGTGRWNFYANGTAENFFGGNTTISVNSTSDALRITQVGTGNALLVEDSANPDSTPFVIDASGNVIKGATSAFTSASSLTAGIQAQSTAVSASSLGLYSFNTTATQAGRIDMGRTRGALGAYDAVLSGDQLGVIRFTGGDGSAMISAAEILALVDGTPGTNDMPGRLVFSTTADGASLPTERMRIDSAGGVGIGSTALTGYTLRLGKNITGAVSPVAVRVDGSIQTDVTTSPVIFQSRPTTAASVTATNLFHYVADPQTFGAGSTITNQYGFNVTSNLTGATNNYGFYSNIAAGTGRWNFYANGTAENFFAGNVGIGTSVPDQRVHAYIASGTARIKAETAGLTDASQASFQLTTPNRNWQLVAKGADNAFQIFDGTAPAERMRIDSSGNVLVGVTSANANGGILQLSKGITFPATQVAATDANTLDDYEEGTFTPTIAGTTTAGTGTYSVQVGRYTKIGNRVLFQIAIVWSAHTGTGNMRVGGLPFTAVNVSNALPPAASANGNLALTASNVMQASVISNTVQMAIDQVPVGGGAITSVPIDTAASIYLSGQYEV